MDPPFPTLTKALTKFLSVSPAYFLLVLIYLVDVFLSVKLVVTLLTAFLYLFFELSNIQMCLRRVEPQQTWPIARQQALSAIIAQTLPPILSIVFHREG